MQNKYINTFNKRYGYSHNLKNGRSEKIQSVFSDVKTKQIEETLVWLSERILNKGNTISYENKYYALYDNRGKTLLPPKTKLTIAKTLKGRLFAVNEKTNCCDCLDVVPKRYEFSKEFDDIPVTTKKKYKPPQHHPWSYTIQMMFKKKDPEMQKLASAYR